MPTKTRKPRSQTRAKAPKKKQAKPTKAKLKPTKAKPKPTKANAQPTTSTPPTKTIAAFKDQLAMQSYLVNSGMDLTPERFRELLRAFRWFGHDPRFEDLHEAAEAALPVLAG